ncbi:hypothetical protein GH141_08785 [bacterium]|nr:hypothetical protein [bacterium]
MRVSDGLRELVRVFFALLSLFWTSITTPPKSSTFQNAQQVEEVARTLQSGLWDDIARQYRKEEIDMLARLESMPKVSCSPPPPDIFADLFPMGIPVASEMYYKPKPIDTKGWDFTLGRYKFD